MKRGIGDSLEETQVKVAKMARSAADWRDGKSLLECNRYMLENEINTDVTFKVKSTTVRAHRTILISRSQVLETQLVGQSVASVINVTDVEPAVFQKMLCYIYCDSVDVDDTDAADLIAVAEKYKISGLKDLCLQKLKTGVSIESVCVVLNHAVDEALKRKCLEFIFRFPQQVLETNGFLELYLDNLTLIIVDDRFNVKEESIFETLIKWSEKECQRQNMAVNKPNQNLVLADVIKLVRFGLMDRKYVKEKCKPFLTSDIYVEIMEQLVDEDGSGIMRRKRGIVTTPEDANSVSSTYSLSNTLRVFDRGDGGVADYRPSLSHPPTAHVLPPRTNLGQPQRYLSEPMPESADCVRPVENVARYALEHRDRVRLGYYLERDNRMLVERFKQTQSGKGYLRDNKDGISFITSQDLKLHGILVYGSHQKPGRYDIELEVLKDTGREGADLDRVHGLKTQMNTDGATKVYELIITPAVYITREKVYTIRALIKGQASYYGENGQHTVLKNGLSVNFVTDNTCLNLTSRDNGQFPGFVFEKV